MAVIPQTDLGLRSNQYDAVLSQVAPRDAAVNCDTYQILQRHRAVSLSQHAFLVGVCLQTAKINYLSKSDKY